MEAEEQGGYRAIIRTRARDWDRRVAPLHVFGGRPLLDADPPQSRVTGRPLPLAFDFDLSDPRLQPLGLAVKRLALLAPWGLEHARGQPFFVRHHDQGRRLELLREPKGRDVEVIPDLPQLPVELEPLSVAEAACDAVDQYPDDHLPLHQIGGHPAWLTGPAPAPACPVSGTPMRFIAAIDSIRRFPLGASETRLAFGSGGLLYVFWSDAADVSASLVQAW